MVRKAQVYRLVSTHKHNLSNQFYSVLGDYHRNTSDTTTTTTTAAATSY